ncbi:MAG: hypothetical protein IKC91_04105 [Clostridia bacterium]|nr:hypothetical protein [Clostridia bacterium]
MIFYKKNTTMPKTSRKTVKFDFSAFPSENSLKNDVLYPVKCQNFRAVSGGIGAAWGTQAAFSENPLEGVTPTNTWLLGNAKTGKLIYSTAASTYSLSLQGAGDANATAPQPSLIYSTGFSSPMRALDYVNAQNTHELYIFSEKGIYFYNGSSFSLIKNSPVVTTGCVYYDRLFSVSALIPYRMYFSAPLEGSNWTAAYLSAGYVDLSPEHGAIHALFSIGKNLYALREYGITRLHTEGENFNFTAMPFSAAFGSVYADSIQRVGACLIFLTSEGLYSFNGNRVEKLNFAFLNGADFATSPDCRAFVYGAHYVLNYLDGKNNRRTLFLNPAEQEGWISDMDISFPISDGNRCFFLDNGIFATFSQKSSRCNGAMYKTWESDFTKLGLGDGRKLLRAVSLQGKGNVQLRIRGEHVFDERVYTLSLNGQAAVHPLLKGKAFSFQVESEDEECLLQSISVTAEIW